MQRSLWESRRDYPSVGQSPFPLISPRIRLKQCAFLRPWPRPMLADFPFLISLELLDHRIRPIYEAPTIHSERRFLVLWLLSRGIVTHRYTCNGNVRVRLLVIPGDDMCRLIFWIVPIRNILRFHSSRLDRKNPLSKRNVLQLRIWYCDDMALHWANQFR
jgi:hypothetical protein